MGREHVLKGSQIGVEVTPGTAVNANRFLATLSFMMRPRLTKKRFRAQGSKYFTSSKRGKEWGEGTYEGAADYNSIVYLLASIFPYAAPVQIGTSGCYTWTFSPNSRTSDTTNRKVYTVEYGDEVAVDDYAYTQVTSLDLALEDEDFTVTGNCVARKPNFNQSRTASPTEIEERPVQFGEIDVFVDATSGALGTTKVEDACGERISIGEKFKPRFRHNSADARTFKDTVEVAPEALFSILTHHEAQSRQFLVDQALNDFLFVRYQMLGEQIGLDGATPVNERIRWDLAGKFEEPEDVGDMDGAWAYRHNFCALHNPTWGKAQQITVINRLATL